MQNSLAHIEINISNLSVSKKFYSKILGQLGWELVTSTDSSVCFKAPDKTHLYLIQTQDEYLNENFHRKNIGLNHIAFRVDSKDAVDKLSAYLDTEAILKLYQGTSKDYSKKYGTKEYYAIFFEDPDRIKLEVVYVI